MHITSLGSAATRSISINTPPEIVVDLVSDPRRLPDWAPRFASAVKPAGQDWLVESGEDELRIRVRVSREHGTIDLLRPQDSNRGAYMRVLSNGAGSEFVFTLIFPGGTPDELIAQQMTTVETELRTVRDLCEAAPELVAGR
jgi:hypothetical protein